MHASAHRHSLPLRHRRRRLLRRCTFRLRHAFLTPLSSSSSPRSLSLLLALSRLRLLTLASRRSSLSPPFVALVRRRPYTVRRNSACRSCRACAPLSSPSRLAAPPPPPPPRSLSRSSPAARPHPHGSLLFQVCAPCRRLCSCTRTARPHQARARSASPLRPLVLGHVQRRCVGSLLPSHSAAR